MFGQEGGLQGSLFDLGAPVPLRLDPGYRPLALGVRNYRRTLDAGTGKAQVRISLEQSPRDVARLDLEVFPPGTGHDADNVRYVSWLLRGLLWSRGGWRITLDGPGDLCEAVAAPFRAGPARAFEREIMGKAYLRPLEIHVQDGAPMLTACQDPRALGGHLDGCRLGFDLGASDFKVAAVRDGDVVFSAEWPWNPRTAPDPAYHHRLLEEGLRHAATFLPRVDAIGGSSAGIIVDNEVRVSSLFRAVPAASFTTQVRPFFKRLQAAWGIPMEVLNDGDVTALAGGLSLETHGILGLALGSSEAAGFLDGQGRLTGWLNELAFAPVDANPAGGADDWSLMPGVGAAYFSQQAVDRLAQRAGFTFPAELGPAERLREVQARMDEGHEGAAEVFTTLGVYLGCTLPWYAENYPLAQAMILGRVTSGPGGALILATAQQILAAEFPDLASRVSMFLPDERSRRVGQAVAAASLPLLPASDNILK
jgi:predicted NBD/HSP70 family sugar kinase